MSGGWRQGAGILEPGRFHARRIGERHSGDAGVCPAGNQFGVLPQVDLTFTARTTSGVAAGRPRCCALLQLKSQLFLGAMALLGGFGVLRWARAGCTWRWATYDVLLPRKLFSEPGISSTSGNQMNSGSYGDGARRSGCSGCWTRNRSGLTRPRRTVAASTAAWIPGVRFEYQRGAAGAQGRFILWPSRDKTSPWWGIPAAARRRWWDWLQKILSADGRTRAG